MNNPDEDTAAVPRAIRTGPGRVVSGYRAKIKREDAARDAKARKDLEESAPPPSPVASDAASRT